MSIRTLPHGVQIRPAADFYVRAHRPAVDIDDHIEPVQHATYDANRAAGVARTFIAASVAGATAGGVTLNANEIEALIWMLDQVKRLTAAANEASGELALAHLRGCR